MLMPSSKHQVDCTHTGSGQHLQHINQVVSILKHYVPQQPQVLHVVPVLAILLGSAWPDVRQNQEVLKQRR